MHKNPKCYQKAKLQIGKACAKIGNKNKANKLKCRYYQEQQITTNGMPKLPQSLCKYNQQKRTIFSKAVRQNCNPEKHLQTLSTVTENNTKHMPNSKPAEHVQGLLAEIKTLTKRPSKNGIQPRTCKYYNKSVVVCPWHLIVINCDINIRFVQ